MGKMRVFNRDGEVKNSEDIGKSKPENITPSTIRSFVKQYMEYEEEQKRVREEKKDLVADFVETYNLPKKEVMIAIRMLKSDIDPEQTTEVYKNIADLVEI